MPAKRTNAVLHIVDGVAYVDVSTPKYPHSVTKIDFADLPLMLDGKTGWCVAKFKKIANTLYVVRRIGGRSKPHMQLLHRVILGLTNPKIEGDHRSGDGLDNRRQNLRRATRVQNCRNGKRRRNGTSIYRGVSWDSERRQWTASIRRKDRKGRESLGRFAGEVAAARAYDKEAGKRYGEFARLNFPEAR